MYYDATCLPQWPIALPGPSFLTARRVLRLFSPLSGVRNPQSLPLALLPLSYTQERDSGPRFSQVWASNVQFPDPRDPRKVNVDFLLALRRSEELLTRSRTPKSRSTDLTTSLSRSFAPLPLVLLIPRYRRPEARVPSKELCVTDRGKGVGTQLLPSSRIFYSTGRLYRRWDPLASASPTLSFSIIFLPAMITSSDHAPPQASLPLHCSSDSIPLNSAETVPACFRI